MRKMWSRRLGAARAGSGWTAASGRDLERIECREWALSGRSVHDENWPGAASPLLGDKRQEADVRAHPAGDGPRSKAAICTGLLRQLNR